MLLSWETEAPIQSRCDILSFLRGWERGVLSLIEACLLKFLAADVKGFLISIAFFFKHVRHRSVSCCRHQEQIHGENEKHFYAMFGRVFPVILN